MTLWGPRDVSLYALSLGLGADSYSAKQAQGHDYLRHVYEQHVDFSPLPTMPFGAMYNTGLEALWAGETITSVVDFNGNLLVHGEQDISWPTSRFGLVDSSTQLPDTTGYTFFEVRGKASVLANATPSGFPIYFPAKLDGSMRHRIVAIVPKSTGVLVAMETLVVDTVMGTVLCVMTGTAFLRQGKLKIPFDDINKKLPEVNTPKVLAAMRVGAAAAPPAKTPTTTTPGVAASAATAAAASPPAVLLRKPIAVAHNQALLYRLNGDRNSIHIDPVIARKVGFAANGPILHGLGTLGMAVYELVKLHPMRRLQSVRCRMTSPVYPGDFLEMLFLATTTDATTGVTVFRYEVVRRDSQQVVLGGGAAALLPLSATGDVLGKVRSKV